MPKRIAVNTIFVVRDGQRRKIMPGQEIDLSNDELADIKAHNPDAVRMPINEGGGNSNQGRTVSVGKGGRGEPAEI